MRLSLGLFVGVYTLFIPITDLLLTHGVKKIVAQMSQASPILHLILYFSVAIRYVTLNDRFDI